MWCRGELFTFLAEGKDTGGAFLANDAATHRLALLKPLPLAVCAY
jgi:hypothetical protein